MLVAPATWEAEVGGPQFEARKVSPRFYLKKLKTKGLSKCSRALVQSLVLPKKKKN
jgi:hypothetical protein